MRSTGTRELPKAVSVIECDGCDNEIGWYDVDVPAPTVPAVVAFHGTGELPDVRELCQACADELRSFLDREQA